MKKFGFVMPDVASPLPTPSETQVPVFAPAKHMFTASARA